MKPNDITDEHRMMLTRRHFFGRSASGVGMAALASMMGRSAMAETNAPAPSNVSQPDFPQPNGVMKEYHMPPKAKRVIYLFQSGAPSQQELFDYKPALQQHEGKELADFVDMNQRVTGMTAGQKSFPMAGSRYKFAKHGEAGLELGSELIPKISTLADDMCLIRSMHTEAINHDPAMTFFQSGNQLPGRPSVGSWLHYGLGTINENLPTFISMVSRGTGRPNCQPLYDRLWGSGFLPSTYAGVKLMSVGDPVLYLSNPDGFDAKARRRMLDDLQQLNQEKLDEFGDPEIHSRIQQYELAYRMQTSVPDLTDFSDDPQHVLDAYGPDVTKRGTYAYNCLLARRLAERDVRFIQLFHMGWDQHFTLPKQLPGQCRDVDQATTALVNDLKQRGLMEDTLVVWGGEFGRTSYCQGTLNAETYGRDHHPRCFSLWMAGAGVKPGMSYGATDEVCYNITENPVHVHDLHATMLHLLGIDHERLTYRFQGRYFRLTDVHGHVIRDILT